MDFPSGLPAEWGWLASAVFAVVVGLGGALAYLRGKREPEQPKAEFYAAGELADMGPVKELVEGVGLLVQQQIKTNLQLERTAVALERGAAAYVQRLEDEATEEEIERRAMELHERWRKDEPRRARKPPE